jgi:hypothetical protein
VDVNVGGVQYSCVQVSNNCDHGEFVHFNKTTFGKTVSESTVCVEKQGTATTNSCYVKTEYSLAVVGTPDTVTQFVNWARVNELLVCGDEMMLTMEDAMGRRRGYCIHRR